MAKNKREKDLLKAEHDFIGAFGSLWSKWGLSRTSGLVLGALFLADEDEPLSASDLAEVLKVSRSTLAASLSELLHAKLIRTSSMLGSRSERYTTYNNLYDLYLVALMWLKHRDVEVSLESARKAHDKIHDGHRVTRIKERLTHAVEFYETYNHWFEVLQRMTHEQFRMYLTLSEEKVSEVLQQKH